MSAALGPCCGLFVVAALSVVATPMVRANEPADRGISLSAAVGGAIDRSVNEAGTGTCVNEGTAIVGAAGVGNIERVAIGGAVDATPGALGNASLSVSALLGYQQQMGRTRLHLFGEAGGHRFSGPDVWLRFAGLRVGAARTVPAHGFVEVGASLFARYDLQQATATRVRNFMGEDGRTDYRLGGFMAGLTLQVGIRLESPHPWNQGVVEP